MTWWLQHGFLCTTTFRPPELFIHPSVQYVRRALLSEIRRPGLEADCSHPYNAIYMAVWFITFFHIFLNFIFYYYIYGCMFCMLLFNFVQVSVMYYCYVCSVLGILLHCVVLCIVCV